jgi:hypothetical protein
MLAETIVHTCRKNPFSKAYGRNIKNATPRERKIVQIKMSRLQSKAW